MQSGRAASRCRSARPRARRQNGAPDCQARLPHASAAAGPPARRILKSEHMGSSELLTVVADTNAEPPSGVEGIDLGMNRGQIHRSIARGIGPLAIARMRHRIECQLLMQMLSSQECRPSGLWDVLTFAQRLPV